MKRLVALILTLAMLVGILASCGGGNSDVDAEVPSGNEGSSDVSPDVPPASNFTISFVIDGETYQTITTSGDKAIAIPENPTKEGYTFDGWYWDKDVWSKPFTANSLMDAPISSDMSVYAKFSAIKYDITYENDGGTHSNPVSYTIEDSFALSAAEKIGYTFVGWYSDAAYTTKVESVSAGSKGAITLYAKFEINNYTISYGNTKDAENNNVTSYNVNTDTITLSDLSKTDYVFEGWYNGEEKVTEIAKGSTGDITLTAKWSVIGYEITYHNVDGATNSNSATYDVEDQPLALSDASKDGYRFLGWYTDAEFTNKVSEIAIGTTGDINLYAKWELVEYTATFMDGTTEVGKVVFTIETDSITEPAVPEHVGYTGAWENYTLGTENITVNAVYTLISYDIAYNNVSGATNNNPATYDVEDLSLTLVDASKDYYTFLGWYSDAAFTNRVTEISVGTTGTVELYAKWEAIEYTATFMDGTTVVGTVKFTVESKSITEPAVPNHTGYNGAWESYTLGTEDITINAVYSLVTYGITYNNVSGATNNNPSSYNVEDQPLTLLDASKAHYTFRGWYSDASFTTKVTEIAVGTTGTVELYAKWEAVEYTITFLYDNEIGDYAAGTTVKTTYTVEDEFEFATLVCKTVGYTFDGWYTEKNVGAGVKMPGITKGTAGDITVYAQFGLEEYDITYNNVNGATNNNPTHYNAASEDFTIYPLTKEGYTFNGWFTDEECTISANLTITKGSNGDITLYAKWTPIAYTIEYVTYGGTATGNPATYIITDKVTFNNATLSGYVFKGWYTAAEGGSKVTGITAGTTGNIVLYAHWDYVSTITFESNGGSLVNSISNVEGTTITAPTAPTKEHYTFAGWYSDAALTKAYSFTTQPTEDITLYAKWTPVVYEIEYVLNGGTNSKNNVTKYTVEDKIELHAPSKVGYTFIGWFTDAEFTSSVVTELKVGTSGKITLYAHYSVNQYTISFESNGGTSVSAITQNYATSVTAPEAPSKNGYTFAGWYSNASLTSKYTFSTMPADNITLYAKWNLETYNITYNLNGGTNNSSNPATYTITSAKITLKAPTKTGYSFAGWYTDAECTEAITEIASGSYGVVELFAKWTATEYTITYVTADGATHSNIFTYTIETDLTTLADAALKGHAFGGWYTNDSYTTVVTTVAGGEIGHKTVYAKFTANTYNVWLDGNEEASCVVSFNLNGAEGTIASQTVTPIATLKYPTVPTRAGYIFAGWYDNENCTGSLYDFTSVVTSDTTLYAKWVKVENATAIAINGSSNVTLNGKYEQMLMFVPLVSGNITITASGSYDTFGVLYSSDMTALVQNDDGASDGSNFLIVYNVTAGKTYYIGTRAFNSTSAGTSTVSIAGITSVLDGGYAITASKGSAAYGQNFTLNVPNARDGYKFLGYADENGVMYTDATGVSVKVWDKASDITLYSVWESTIYNLTLIDIIDNSVIATIPLEYGSRLNLNLYIPESHSGKSFRGWFDNKECSGEIYNFTTMPDSNITLYAAWKTFSLGDIKYDIDKLAISVDDEITADLFSAMCLDSNGNLADFSVVINGKQEIGETITVKLIATSGNEKKQVVLSNVKVYGNPTLLFDNTVDYFNLKDGLSATWFSASGKDSFGNATSISVYVDYEYVAGEYVTVTIEAIDVAGNSTYAYIDDIKVYGEPQITYDKTKVNIKASDNLTADLFGAYAVDSFGKEVAVTALLYSGTKSAGNIITIRLNAVDQYGNTASHNFQVKVYGIPQITNPSNLVFLDTDIINADSLGISALDSFNNELDMNISVKEGAQIGGQELVILVSATDLTGNTCQKEFKLTIRSLPKIEYDCEALMSTENPTYNYAETLVKFNLNGGSGQIPSQTITNIKGLSYPTPPTRTGYIFRGWFTDSKCTKFFDFSSSVSGKTLTLYAGWQAIPTTINGSSDNVHIVNASSTKLSYNTNSTSSSRYIYIFFAINNDNADLCYWYNCQAINNGVNFYVYNLTDNRELKYIEHLVYSGGSSVSGYSAGDVLYIRLDKYNVNYQSSTFYFSVKNNAPQENGLSDNWYYGAEQILGATAVDCYGNKLNVTATLASGQIGGGSKTIFTLQATDQFGNTSLLDTLAIPVYDINDISLKYNSNVDSIKISSQGEEFGAIALDSFGEECRISIKPNDGYELKAGSIIDLYLIATDKAGNYILSDLIKGVKIYDTPSIATECAITEKTTSEDLKNLDLVWDSFGEKIDATFQIIGEQKIGNTIQIKVVTKDCVGNIFEGIIDNVKVYGNPTLEFDQNIEYVNINGGLTASHFNASGLDTFNQPTRITVSIEGDYTAGDLVTVLIESIDPAGNIVSGRIENVKAYGNPTIVYNTTKDSISDKDVIKCELFDVTAIDSFGEAVQVDVSLAQGTIIAGNTVIVRISATDSNGNITNIDISCKVYGTPVISDAVKTDVKECDEITADLLGIIAVDTYKTQLDVSLEIKNGSQTAGNTMVVTARVVDIAGNIATKDYTLKVYGTPIIIYDKDALKVSEDVEHNQTGYIITFDLNGASGSIDKQIVNETVGIVYPSIPTRSGYAFKGWYTDATCKTLYDFTADIQQDLTLYAGWQSMISSNYYSRNYIKIVDDNNNSSDYYYVSTSGTSSSSARYTYFTALHDGTYTMYYRNGYSDTNYRTYLYIYNVTQGKVIKSNSNISSSSYDSISFNANAGDVIYVRNYRYNTSYSGSFYFYIEGAQTPTDGGIAINPPILVSGASTVLNASAKDSFGQDLIVTAEKANGTLEGGECISYVLTATDHLGNTATITTKDIKIYDINDILLTYSAGISNDIKYVSKGEEFNAFATDSFGVQCEISLEAASGFEFKPGNIIDLYVVATDAAGNKIYSDIIKDIKIYDTPVIVCHHNSSVITSNTNIPFMYSVYDSFNCDSFEEELYAEITASAELIPGTVVQITVKAKDIAGNQINMTYSYAVVSEEIPAFVEFYIDDQLYTSQFYEDVENYTLPIPVITDLFYGWVDDNGNFYSYYDGIGLLKLSEYTKLSAYTYPEGYEFIETKDDLFAIQSDGKYVLTKNLNLGSAAWTPLAFSGVFEGNNFTISNFTITGGTKVGFFSSSSGTIKNLHLSSFTVTTTKTNNYIYIGGLVGEMTGGIIENCSTQGTLTATTTGEAYVASSSRDGIIYIGGLVGWANGTIKNCESNVTIKAYSSAIDTRNSSYNWVYYPSAINYAGGLIGYLSAGEVANCLSSGTVYCSATSTYRACDTINYAGGLIGMSGGQVNSCCATGKVTTITNSLCAELNYVGGFIGSNSGTVINCYSTGAIDVTGTGEILLNSFNGQGNTCGGFIGRNSGSITNCYCTGLVKITGNQDEDSYFKLHIGGLVGYNLEGSITRSYSTSSISLNYTTCRDYYTFSVGGLVGVNDEGSISSCYRYSSQSITLSVNSESKSVTNTLGSSYSTSSIWSYVSNYWNSTVWSLSNSSNATLKDVGCKK